ncbi:C1 family peptidase [Lactobacillus sp. DCY120]|uniref:Aminopeptidase n=1 Tax=Bombilactobacillus apium TaxID=2675299 RepID=A0A850RBG0_9LACO|nr:C1 family peptidase [Bombilactobacillus apium]NVY96656.1 C1 family peptidase [Bombilactobacillus apium]
MTQAIDFQQIKQFQTQFHAQSEYQTVAQAVQNNGIHQTSQDPQAQVALNPVFSVEIPTGAVGNQKHSGRCWLFSALTTLRTQFAQKYQVKDFELSQSYSFFYDRLEKANWFYQEVVATAQAALTDRRVHLLLTQATGDGGQWKFAINLIQKYGVVPKSVMPETKSSEDTTEFNQVLNHKLRQDAQQLRQLVQDQATSDQIQTWIEQRLAEVYRICVYSFGQPPREFSWSQRNDQEKLLQETAITPQDFYAQYFSLPLADYYQILNIPQKGKPLGRTYRAEGDGNVVGASLDKGLNLPIQRLKQLTIKQLQAGDPVWFGNDVLAQSQRQQGLLAGNLYDYGQLFDLDLKLTKGERFDVQEADISHAMVFTGVDLNDQGEPLRWKVENSWGAKIGSKGYFVMDDAWFDDYVYEVIINKQHLSATEEAEFQQEPIVLPAWDVL